MQEHPTREMTLDRRGLIVRGGGLVAAGAGLPAFLAACGGDDDEPEGTPADQGAADATGEPVVGDVLDHALTSDEWEGSFGFVSLRLHRGLADGEDAWFIRTDASDEKFAATEGLVFAPKLENLRDEALSGELFLVEDGPAVLSSAPDRDDYTPAWRVQRVTWRSSPRELASVDEVRSAEREGELSVTDTAAVMNAAVCDWSTGQLGVDTKLRAYLEGGQLIEPPDTEAGEIKFKLHECFPAARYIVTDHSVPPAAEMTVTAFAPGLHEAPRKAGATGRTNVFMNGVSGPGPMEHQPRSSTPIPAIRSGVRTGITSPMNGIGAATLACFARSARCTPPGMQGSSRSTRERPTPRGEVFTVNCPVPVTAPATFKPA